MVNVPTHSSLFTHPADSDKHNHLSGIMWVESANSLPVNLPENFWLSSHVYAHSDYFQKFRGAVRKSSGTCCFFGGHLRSHTQPLWRSWGKCPGSSASLKAVAIVNQHGCSFFFRLFGAGQVTNCEKKESVCCCAEMHMTTALCKKKEEKNINGLESKRTKSH